MRVGGASRVTSPVWPVSSNAVVPVPESVTFPGEKKMESLRLSWGRCGHGYAGCQTIEKSASKLLAPSAVKNPLGRLMMISPR